MMVVALRQLLRSLLSCYYPLPHPRSAVPKWNKGSNEKGNAVFTTDYGFELQNLFSIIEDDKLSAAKLNNDLEEIVDNGCFPTNPEDTDFPPNSGKTTRA
jgi:hypothetical protein